MTKKPTRECPDQAKHTDSPTGYLAYHEWAEKMTKTHDQYLCLACGLWAIWKPKPANVKRPGHLRPGR